MKHQFKWCSFDLAPSLTAFFTSLALFFLWQQCTSKPLYILTLQWLRDLNKNPQRQSQYSTNQISVKNMLTIDSFECDVEFIQMQGEWKNYVR